MSKTRNFFVALSIASAILIGGANAHAQAPVASLEGPLLDVVGNTMNVMGVAVIVPNSAPITSPTAKLKIDQLKGAALPGRTTPGFIGGTAIINGTVMANGNVRATDVFVEPSENVLIGTITSSTCTDAQCTGSGSWLTLQKRPLRAITDRRMPAVPILNDFGFEADLTDANLVGAAAAAEGYFANNRFYYFLLEITGAPLARPTETEISIQRAQCRADTDGIQLEVRGGVHTPATGVVSIDAGGGVSGTTNAVVAAGVFGTYRFRQDFPGITSCPDTVTADFGGASATAGVDVL